MNALTMIFAAAVTLMAATSHAELKVLPCGKIYNDQGVSLTNNKGVLNASNIASFQRHSNTQSSQTGAVQVDN